MTRSPDTVERAPLRRAAHSLAELSKSGEDYLPPQLCLLPDVFLWIKYRAGASLLACSQLRTPAGTLHIAEALLACQNSWSH